MANTLFILRVLPLAGSAFVTLVFAVPAFVLLESGTIDEDLGTLAFGVGAILIIAAAVFRVMSTRARTSRVVGEWVEGAETLDAGTATPTLQAKSGTPPLLLVRIPEPRVLVSETAVALLNGDELRVAVRHEIEHMRSRDNLKKLVVHCAPFRGMAGLENAWNEATELAADHEAVSNSDEAVDLAAALLKLSELAPVQEAPTLTTGLMTALHAGEVASRAAAQLECQRSSRGCDRPEFDLYFGAGAGQRILCHGSRWPRFVAGAPGYGVVRPLSGPRFAVVLHV